MSEPSKTQENRDSVVDACGYLACLSMAHAALGDSVE